MKKRIGGWWRLWIAMSALYGLFMLWVVVLDWPKDWITRKLSSEELQSLTEESRGLIGSGWKVDGNEVVEVGGWRTLKEDPVDALAAKYGVTLQDDRPKKQEKSPVANPPRKGVDDWVDVPIDKGSGATKKGRITDHETDRLEANYQASIKARDNPYMAIADGRTQPLPNGEYLQFKKIPTPAQVDLVKKDYARLQKALLWKERRSNLLRAVFAWVLPCAFFLGLGLTIRWVFRGFRNKPSGQLPTPVDDTQPPH